jgi:two-component system chemotaxis response regulator CheB
VIAQDEESSVVFGMPGVVIDAGLAHHVLPLRSIANLLMEIVPS